MFDFQDLIRSRGGSSLIIDLSGVPYMDSAGLGAILGGLASCQRRGLGFAVGGVLDRVRTLFNVTRVESLIPAFATVEEAERQIAHTG